MLEDTTSPTHGKVGNALVHKQVVSQQVREAPLLITVSISRYYVVELMLARWL